MNRIQSTAFTVQKCCERIGKHRHRYRASSSTASNGVLDRLRQQNENDIVALPEFKARTKLSEFLANGGATTSKNSIVPIIPPSNGFKHMLTPAQMRLTLDAAMATFHLHVESRIAALCGQGFYTIGPCGEEMLASIGWALDPYSDAVALHYRHLSVSILRQLRLGRKLEEVILDRARGHVVSKLDPVTGGVHCAIGSAKLTNDEHDRTHVTGSGDYVVTSTLASQCPPAVGRALGFSMVEALRSCDDDDDDDDIDRNTTRPISFVTIGDGSVHNAHFLSAFNLARHARFRRKKCPVVFGVSDNGLSISYATDGYADYLFSQCSDQHSKGGSFNDVRIFKANGCDMMDVYDKTLQASSYSRKYSAPSLILYKELTRRFGHAATDRQHAYLDADEIASMAESDVVAIGIVQTVNWNAITYGEAHARFEEIGDMVKHSFNIAAEEPKITSRDEMLDRVSKQMVSVPQLPSDKLRPVLNNNQREKKEVMRKHMTRVISEVMEVDPKIVYIGEDVEHGGYYLVTDELADKFKGRVIDFPPDETTLLGAAMGFSQVGLLPIVEIPYAKYLDCAADMFYELSLSNWLTNGQCPNGMIIRVQGFDRGIFGGNFHTHNMISHIPPGVDVVCYSNGEDYVRGFRNAITQARDGRVVVFIDSTNLLNLRHLHEKDRGWETTYPLANELISFHDVRRFGHSGKALIVTYGNGVVTALRARRALAEQKVINSESELDIIDSPYLSNFSNGLREAVASGRYEHVLFCDVCKEGPGSNVLSSTIMSLKKQCILPTKWDFVAAPRTYNPLGNTITFLSEEDIIRAYTNLISM